MTRHSWLPLLLSTPLAGCATTDARPGADVSYRLPRTNAAVSLAMTLHACGKSTIELSDADLTIAGVAGARPELWTLEGSALASARVKRSVKITTTDDGNRVITGINSSATDRSPAIIGNVIKTIVLIAPVAGFGLAESAKTKKKKPVPVPLPTSLCSRQVDFALARASLIQQSILALQQQLSVEPDSTASGKFNKTLKAYATELAGLKTGILHVETSGSLVLPDKAAGMPVAGLADANIELDSAPFEKWFTPSKDGAQRIEKYFGLTGSAVIETLKGRAVTVSDPAKLRSCGLAMWVPATIPVRVAVKGSGAAYSSVGGLEKAQRLPVSQWADPVELCLDAGFGEDRSINLTYNKYGETITFDWTSAATAENVSGAVAGAAPDVVSLANTLHPAKVDVQKAQIDALKTQQQLNELKACQATLDAGGYDCSKAAAP